MASTRDPSRTLFDDIVKESRWARREIEKLWQLRSNGDVGVALDFNKTNEFDVHGNDGEYFKMEIIGSGAAIAGTGGMTNARWSVVNTSDGGMEFVQDAFGAIILANFNATDLSEMPNALSGQLPSQSGKAAIRLHNTSDGDVEMVAFGNHCKILIYNTGNDIEITTVGGVVYIRGDGGPYGGSGDNALIVNSGGQDMFVVKTDGSLHGMTGQTLVFDL